MENQEYAMFIDGAKHPVSETFSVYNPATGEIVGEAPQASAADLETAVAAAKAAFPAWAATPDADRAAACLAIADKVDEHAEELARLITMEQGKPLGGVGSRFEAGGIAAWARYTSSIAAGEQTLAEGDGGNVAVHRKPIGVVGSITPWNWPALIATWHILPAIRTGNTVVVKPSPYTPLSTLLLVELMNQVLPAGVVNVVTGDDKAANLGALMSAHKDVRKIIFTGSTATGSKIAATAAPMMKRLTLELGGNDAGIVLPDVDPAAIAEGLFWAGFINMGQTCAAMKRLYVHEDVYDAVCDALVSYAANIPMGNGLDEGSVMGPIANRMQYDKVKALADAGAKEGRVLLGGGEHDGLFFPLTIIADLDNGNPLVDEEQFGPVLPIIKYSDVEDAIAKANALETGLGGSVWSSDTEAAKAVAQRLECGTVWINQHGMIRPDAPFGGTKMSGIGVEFGQEGLHAYTDIQTMIS
ncbi:aldehyde dehydrogenase family protein [Aurantiacibacter rhizosphaerae]|nr:aldehyde dehydrogenase family protein [Aurantiacibacter rhizosphaerae]